MSGRARASRRPAWDRASAEAAFERAIPEGVPLLVDTSVVLAYLGGGEATSERARQLFDAFTATGRNPTGISSVTAAEILVRPFRRGDAAVATAEGFLRHFDGMRIVDIDFAVAREAARIRAATGLPMPDALIVASAAPMRASTVITNDGAWPARLADACPDLSVVVLAAFAPVAGGPP